MNPARSATILYVKMSRGLTDAPNPDDVPIGRGATTEPMKANARKMNIPLAKRAVGMG
jgi:hypothetical protein